MRKFVLISMSVLFLVACSSSGVSVNELAGKMPPQNRSVMIEAVAADNPLSNGMVIAGIAVSGSNDTRQLIDALAVDNLNIGVFGRSDSVNKATVLYALEHAKVIGKNTSIYFVGSSNDRAELEKVARSKNIVLHYFVKG